MNLCKCGCGAKISDKKTFVSGHNRFGMRKPVVEKECLQCKKMFSGTKLFMERRVYCSNTCRDNFRKENTGASNPSYTSFEMKCSICNKSFITQPARLKNHQVYCSMECGREGRKRKISNSRRKSISLGKNAARRRDDFKCRICSFDFVTAVHHIIPKSSGGNDDISNLITLCPNHHYMAHANLYEKEYLFSLIPTYDFDLDITKPIKPSKQTNRVNFRS